MNCLTTLAAAGLLAVSAGSASAATITLAGSSATEDSCRRSNFTTSVACDGTITATGPGEGGNVSANDLNGVFAADGITLNSWSQIDRIGTVSAGTSTGENGLFRVVANVGSSQGTWSLIPNFAFDPTMIYAFALKGARDQVAYVMDYVAGGNWFSSDLQTPSGQTAGLSNITLFATRNPTTPPVVPLPAAGWLLVGGLAGLAALKRRRTAA
jgi:hypothetical protein